MKVDLHLHTTASDGKLTPQEIVYSAANLGFSLIAITDHDSVDGIPSALATAQAYPSLMVIPGIELNADIPHNEIHILGYFIDCTNTNFRSTLQWLRDSRRERAAKIVTKLHTLGINVDWHRVRELAQDAPIGRPHIAQALLERGYVSSIKDAFVKYIGRDRPAYVEHARLTPVEAVKLIRETRGLPVLAHPAEISNLNELLDELKNIGLIGLEVFYNHYSSDIITKLLSAANAHGLVPTGGSDFHGLDGELMDMLPETALPRESVEQLFTLAGKTLELERFKMQVKHTS